MNTYDQERWSKKRTFIYFYIVLALLTLLVAASYTWFSISRTPRVSDMDLYISARSGLELATEYDAPDEAWGTAIDFLDIVTESAPLKPVTWSAKQDGFLTIRYGSDGRMMSDYALLTDKENANRTDGDGYYVMGTFFVRSGEPCSVSLAEAVEVNAGENGAGTYVIGAPRWDAQAMLHYDGGNGAETAVRLGFRIKKVTSTNDTSNIGSEFFVYEPNCDRHLDGSTGYRDTPSVDGTDTLAVNLIRQTASTWTEANPVQRKVTIKQLGTFETNPTLFSIQPGEIYRVQLYIWLEGQDTDCVNFIDEAQILANVQFTTDLAQQGGLVPVGN